MKIISNYLGREQRESWREEKTVKQTRSRKWETKVKEKEAKEGERESVLPLASSGSVARVRRYLRKARGSRREISWTREKVEAKTQPVYESVFFRS